MWLSVFEKNVLEGGYLDVEEVPIGWNSVIGSFVISKSSNNINIMGEKLWDMTLQLTSTGEEGIENLAENIQK